MLFGERADAVGQAEHLEVRNVLGGDAERERDVPALLEGIDAEAREIGVLVRDVEVPRLLEGLEPLRRAFPDQLDELLHVPIDQDRGLLQRGERAVAPKDRR